MNYLSKKSAVTMGLYIVLAVCVLTVIGVSIYSLANKPPQALDHGDGDFGLYYNENTLPAADSFQPPATLENQPVLGEVPTTALEAMEPVTGVLAAEVPAPPAFVKVLAGTVVKEHNPDMPAFNVTMNDYRTHKGVDIAAEEGSPVFAMTDGEITQVALDPMMGQTVTITHASGLVSYYANLGPLADGIQVGATVKSGDTIGCVGASSLIEGVDDDMHLHFEVFKDGLSVNPRNYMEYGSPNS